MKLLTFPMAFMSSAASTGDDADNVIAAIEATGVTLTTTQKDACRDRIAALKLDEIWSGLIAYYGFLGGTAATHAINWRAPGIYDLTWSSGVTHTDNGVQGNGLNAYGDTGYNPSLGPLTNSTHLSFYSRSNIGSQTCDIGVIDGTKEWGLYSRWTDNNLYYGAPGADFSAANNQSDRHIIISTSPTATFAERDGAILGSSSTAATSVQTINYTLRILARNPGTGSLIYPSGRQYSSFSFGESLTQVQAIAFSASEQAYQTALGRQV